MQNYLDVWFFFFFFSFNSQEDMFLKKKFSYGNLLKDKGKSYLKTQSFFILSNVFK